MNLSELMANPYEGYAYAYPHKTAYRQLDPPRPLGELWAAEDKRALTLYVHVPVCEMRCGFCNLFTTTGTDEAFEAAYVAALERQAMRVRKAVGDASFSGAAVGGGTPTFLSIGGLARVLRILDAFGASPARVPTSVETSPRTAEPDKLRLLRSAGVERVSIGVQTFDEEESGALGRSQKAAWVVDALDAIRAAGFPVLNVDLMYGAEGQDEASFVRSIDRALAWRPEEIYLYPVYVRPLTGIARRGGRSGSVRPRNDARLLLYRAGRARLTNAGYDQVSMRFFRRSDAPPHKDHSCQEEGTVGLGCGARSYTRALHYASEWAVGASDVRAILRAYMDAPDAAFDAAWFGTELSGDDQRRRYVLKTLLRRDGLPLGDYAAWFGSTAERDLPALGELVQAGLAERRGDRLALTEGGLELSDAIGPLLYAPATRAKMAAFELR
jgi:oxygen-independent coproporphyrinogen-3 oxidase